jgi:peroxiredoxin
MTRLGKPATPFELSDAHGLAHRLEDYRDRWLLLVFHRHLG